MCKLGGRDHNATSYSTETTLEKLWPYGFSCRDHNATSYSTETRCLLLALPIFRQAEIITLRAIALKQPKLIITVLKQKAEIITLRAIALKHPFCWRFWHPWQAEIITLRAIALKQIAEPEFSKTLTSRDHNATSYSTETK